MNVVKVNEKECWPGSGKLDLLRLSRLLDTLGRFGLVALYMSFVIKGTTSPPKWLQMEIKGMLDTIIKNNDIHYKE
jgi:hypothetical protein